MTITRRQFLKLCAGSGIAIGASGVLLPEIVAALERAAAGNPPVLWIFGGRMYRLFCFSSEHCPSKHCRSSSKNHQS